MDEQTGVAEQGVADLTPESGVEATSPVAGQETAPESQQETVPVEQTTERVDPQEGIRQALEAERNRRQAAEFEAMRYKQLIAQQQVQPQPDPLASRDPDDVVTVAEMRDLIQQVEQQQKQSFQDQNIQMSVNRAKEKYRGSALSYDDAVKIANEKFEPSMINAILSSNDPAETLYQLVTAQPEYKAQQAEAIKSQAIQSTVDTVTRHTNQPSTLSGVGGGANTEMDEAKRYATMTDEEFEAEIQKAKWS